MRACTASNAAATVVSLSWGSSSPTSSTSQGMLDRAEHDPCTACSSRANRWCKLARRTALPDAAAGLGTGYDSGVFAVSMMLVCVRV
jgi:hypothetical protein